MDSSLRDKLARALLGTGLAGKGADIKRLYPMYQKESIEAQSQGKKFPSFEEWSKTYQSGE
jgi:hypothetical protein